MGMGSRGDGPKLISVSRMNTLSTLIRTGPVCRSHAMPSSASPTPSQLIAAANGQVHSSEGWVLRAVSPDMLEYEDGRAACLINIGSPIARAPIGKVEGDTAVVQAPGGDRAYEVVAVQYI